MSAQKNHVKISCPEITPSMGPILLNGRSLRDVASLKIEVSGKPEDPFVKVTAVFLASFELEGTFSGLVTDGAEMQITT
jgi:hypothetical protein